MIKSEDSESFVKRLFQKLWKLMQEEYHGLVSIMHHVQTVFDFSEDGSERHIGQENLN